MSRGFPLPLVLSALVGALAACDRQAPPPTWNGPGLTPAAAVPSGAPLLRITFVDVGQGDSALLETSDGHVAMIDAGPPEGAAHLLEVLVEHHVSRLDFLMISHPHLDHLGGARKVLDAVACDRFIDPAFPQPTSTYDRLLTQVQAKNIPFVRGQTGLRFPLGNAVTVELLQPHDPFIDRSRSEANANSIVARVTVGAVKVLFSGDAEHETEARLLQESAAFLQADVLKVAHHGSAYASGADFLDAVRPSFAVMSCGAGNEYGHPAATTLQSLTARHVQWFRTDVQGDVVLYSDGAHVSMQTARTGTTADMNVPGVSRAGRSNAN